jgi:hypothetical protein
MELKTKSKMLFPGWEKSGPCDLVTAYSTKCAIHKGFGCLISG